jgi:hypothetical protein
MGHAWLLLLAPAVYWDDWILYEVKTVSILRTFKETGSIFNLAGYLHVLMQAAGPWLYRIAVFLLMFGAGLCLDRILVRHDQVPDAVRFLIVLFFLTLPFNMARATMITMPYSLCYFMFFLAWMLIDRHKIVSSALFLVSFNTNSLLVFYILPILDSALHAGVTHGLTQARQFAIKYCGFLCLPFAFWIVKQTWFKPTGLYKDYNQHFNVGNIGNPINAQLQDMLRISIEPVSFLVALVVLGTLLRNLNLPKADWGWGLPCKLLVAGVVAIVGACFPYWVLGLVPRSSDWDSRHQLLMPLGAAMLLTSSLCVLHRKVAHWIAVAVAAASISICANSYFALYRDWNKQLEIITLLGESSAVRAADIVIFHDNATELNALRRKYRFYEWNGLMSAAFNDEKRLGLSPADFKKFQEGQFASYWKAGSRYRCGEFKAQGALDIVKVIINPAVSTTGSKSISGAAVDVTIESMYLQEL